MSKLDVFFLFVCFSVTSTFAQAPASDTSFAIALPAGRGQLRWQAAGFKIVQSSAKPNGMEIGLRGKNPEGRLEFLGFLFVVSGQGTLTSAKCRDGALGLEQKANKTLKIVNTSRIPRQDNIPVEMVTYTAAGANHAPSYVVRGFVATGDLCGDLEVYGSAPINSDQPDIKKLFESYSLDANYAPQFNDVFLYAQILYRDQRYKEAAPLFEASLAKLPDNKDQTTMRRVATDQAGMAYGISGDTKKARALFDVAIAKDPDYPLYYYNLACADAQENKLADARTHLQQAFERKGNVIAGEALPDPAKDDSFLPYRNNKDFWKFVESLH
jgi:tetratricopeptide (TPR) repeat protein